MGLVDPTSSGTLQDDPSQCPDVLVSRSPATLLEAETDVAIGPNGRVVVAFIGAVPSGRARIFDRISEDGGTHWSAVNGVGPFDLEGSDPVLAVDAAGVFTLVWVGFRLVASTESGTIADAQILAATLHPSEM